MKIIRVFPRKNSHTPNDDLSFIGYPPLNRPPADQVHISCVFTWDKAIAEDLKLAWSQYFKVVKIGGPAFDAPGGNFEPGLYLRPGITTTSYGCNNQCPWCLAWKREGKLKEEKIIHPGNYLQDNNILQCSKNHQDKVWDMLSRQSDVHLTGGLDAREMTTDTAERIRSINVRRLFFSCDTDGSITPLRKAMKMLQIPPHHHKIRCYVLLKYNPEETLIHALIRLLQVWEAGCIPAAQLYQPPDKYIEYPDIWKKFVRIWSRPAISSGVITRLLNLDLRFLDELNNNRWRLIR